MNTKCKSDYQTISSAGSQVEIVMKHFSEDLDDVTSSPKVSWSTLDPSLISPSARVWQIVTSVTNGVNGSYIGGADADIFIW